MLYAIAHVSKSESPMPLIEMARLMAKGLETNWCVIFINSTLDQELKPTWLNEVADKVRFLGGQIKILIEPAAVTSIKKVIDESEPVKIIVFTKPSYFSCFNRARYITSKLQAIYPEADVILTQIQKRKRKLLQVNNSLKNNFSFLYPYILVLAWSIGSLIFGWMVSRYVGYKSVGFIFLLVTLFLGLKTTLGLILMYSALTSMGWYLFLIPNNDVTIEDVIFGAVSFFAGCVIGTLAFRIKRREGFLWLHQNNLAFLYDVTKIIADSRNLEATVAEIYPKIKLHMKGQVALILLKEQDQLVPLSLERGWWLKDSKNIEVANWCISQGKESGISTEFFSKADAYYIPMNGREKVVGVLSFLPDHFYPLTFETKSGLNAIAHQLALLIERDLFLENFKKVFRLEEAEKLHQTILNSISHELKTPLTALAGFATLLQDPDKALSRDQAKLISSEIQANVERLNRIVSHLLDSSRLQSGALDLNKQWCTPTEIFEDLLSSLPKNISSSIEVQCSENVPAIYADQNLILQCLSNLILNAVAYGHGPENIKIGANSSEDSYVQLWVSDRGPGVPKDLQERIFDRFYRLPGSPTGGSGLGLYLVKQIVELHGGSIDYQINPEGGSIFTISIYSEGFEDVR